MVMCRWGKALARLLNLADREAQQNGDQYLSSEVVLLAACDDNGELGDRQARSGAAATMRFAAHPGVAASYQE